MGGPVDVGSFRLFRLDACLVGFGFGDGATVEVEVCDLNGGIRFISELVCKKKVD